MISSNIMSKCIIYCFSGTGNTNLICKMLSSEMALYGYECETFAITYMAYKQKSFPNPNDYGLALLIPGMRSTRRIFLINS